MTAPTPPAPFVVVLAVYPDITQLDFTGPYEVFQRLPGAKVIVASAQGGPVEAEGGLTFLTARLADIERCDLFSVGGGFGQPAAMADPEFMTDVRRLGGSATWLTSVCSGSLILGAAGLLRGKRSACHWAWRDLLPMFGAEPINARVVRDGNLFSGGGVTAGIDFALTVAAEVFDPATAQSIQLMLEYAPEPPFDAGSPETAPPGIVQALKSRFAQVAPERKAAIAKALA